MSRLGGWIASVVLAAGCGRYGFEERRTAPDAEDAALAPEDAAPDAVPPDALSLVQSLVVPVDGTIVMSQVLEAGRIYTLVAQGTFVEVPPAEDPLGDAEYYDLTGSTGPTDVGASIDIGLAIDDDVVDDVKTPHWGPYRADHVYTVPYTGTGAPLRAQIHDCCYGDNTGQLQLVIYQ